MCLPINFGPFGCKTCLKNDIIWGRRPQCCCPSRLCCKCCLVIADWGSVTTEDATQNAALAAIMFLAGGVGKDSPHCIISLVGSDPTVRPLLLNCQQAVDMVDRRARHVLREQVSSCILQVDHAQAYFPSWSVCHSFEAYSASASACCTYLYIPCSLQSSQVPCLTSHAVAAGAGQESF